MLRCLRSGLRSAAINSFLKRFDATFGRLDRAAKMARTCTAALAPRTVPEFKTKSDQSVTASRE
jgi:hypothetical protein